MTAHFPSWCVWLAPTIFYALQFCLRSSAGVFTESIMHDFLLNAGQVGSLFAGYYVGYTAMQIPAGVLLDRYGMRPVMTMAMAVCALGCVSFAWAQSSSVLYIARFMIGVGSAFAFLSCIKAARSAFSLRMFPIFIGVSVILGMIGAIFAGEPIAALLHHFSWRHIILSLGALTAFFAVVGFFLAKQDKAEKSQESPSEIIKNIAVICKNRQTWILGIYIFLSYTFLSGFADMWGVPFMQEVYKMPIDEASSAVLTYVYIGLGVGSFVMPVLARRFSARYLLVGCSLVRTCIFAVLLFFPTTLSGPMLKIMLLLCGITTGDTIPTFAYVSSLHSDNVQGTASGVHNSLSMLSGIIFQPLVGSVINYGQNSMSLSNAYILGCSFILAMSACGIACACFLRHRYLEA